MLAEEKLRCQINEVCRPETLNLRSFDLPLTFDDGTHSTLKIHSDTWVRFAQWQGILLSNQHGIARAYFIAHGRFSFRRHQHPYRERITVVAGRMMECEAPSDKVQVASPEPYFEEGYRVLRPGDTLQVEANTMHDPIMLDDHNEIMLEWITP